MLFRLSLLLCLSVGITEALVADRRSTAGPCHQSNAREKIRLHTGWRFWRSESIPDGVVYEKRSDANDDTLVELKPWIMPIANEFIQNPADRHETPSTEPDVNIPYVSPTFNDAAWENVTVPHDWAIKMPFLEGENPIIPPAMGQLPVHGVGWYRHNLLIRGDANDTIYYLDLDGGMSYPMVWINGHLVGGWPFGYNSFRLNISPYLVEGDNIVAIRTENPAGPSSRWYPGAGLYRNVWLTKVAPVHVAHWGTTITSQEVSKDSATVDLSIKIQSVQPEQQDLAVTIVTEVFEIDLETNQRRETPSASFPPKTVKIRGSQTLVNDSIIIKSPKLWGPPPAQTPNLHVAVTSLYAGSEAKKAQLFDTYETVFGIRSLTFDPNRGVLINGEHVYLQGANHHHDLGALGAAYNHRAAERQLEILQEVGVNALRMSHNPPAPELLDLADRMGFLVMNEIFDSWSDGKSALDFHLIFDDWKEPDLRALIRRDRNHPSVISWSYGNEVKEQVGNDALAANISIHLRDICREEDPTRLSTAALNRSPPSSLLAKTLDLISLNYQGEGIRHGPAYANLTGTRTAPQYAAFHEAFPDKVITSSEFGSSLSLRGSFSFPVTPYDSAPLNETSGSIPNEYGVSAYELYTAGAGSSPDRVFHAQDEHPYVSGGFVWTGWDYIGEPYFYKGIRSGYWGIVDLAGFKKERFWLYQSRWRPDLPMAHIVPHWNWPDRVGENTPVHVFSSADEAELFVNGESKGRRSRESDPGFYRFKWDEIKYEPGEVRVVTYKDGKEWATDLVKTTGNAKKLRLKPDRSKVVADDEDLSFVTIEIVDDDGNVVPLANNKVKLSVSSGPGEIVATDNGHPADFTPFPSLERNAFHGLLLAVIRAGAIGRTTITAQSEGLESAELSLEFV
ncbi:beta-galactosidase [Colletotrichum truncatum]|uniref:Beta-galactosidase n=1 Tax=Colletotrichum truncatum TaxID=5467 RepID=A0ACC3ZD04_COLTU|nr:beta-galactosidase [Colletotrichum truncatum]KAF6797964.1 beta-galactosidase [Colletotrichum truncatum]